MHVSEAIGPACALVVWAVIFLWRAMRHRAVAGIYTTELLAVVGCLLTLQLLLDLHTRFLGDIVIGALHLYMAGWLVERTRRDRLRCDGDRGRNHEQL
jgi:hypothetical protein